jgi:hypothetical protein
VPLAQRLPRWETGPLLGCKTPGCITFRVIDPLAGKPLEEGKPHPGLVLSITRDERAGGMPLEVVIEARAKPPEDGGKPPALPLLIVNLPPNVDRLIDQLDARFLGAQLAIIDASPYPRACPSKAGCVDKLDR